MERQELIDDIRWKLGLLTEEGLQAVRDLVNRVRSEEESDAVQSQCDEKQG